MLIRQLGIDHINKGRNFKLQFGKKLNEVKQIDVFAVDEKHKAILVIECKESETDQRTSLRSDLIESTRMKEVYEPNVSGHGYKPIFIYISQNRHWSAKDTQHALDSNIYVIDDENIRYFEDLIKNLGSAARPQLYGEFLTHPSNTKVHGKVKIPAIETTVRLKGKQNKKVYNFIVQAKDLVNIAFINHRGLRGDKGKNQYQRMIKKNRLKEISNFVSNGGQFVTNILVNFMGQPKFERLSKDNQSENRNITFGHLTLPDRYRSAIIIDGQHRLFGCASDDATSSTPLMVTAFDQLDEKEEIDMFVTINSKQQKIPPSLITGLKTNYIDEDNPTKALEAMASSVFDQLANDRKSPFFGRFAPQDGTPRAANENLKWAGITKSLIDSKLIGSVPSGSTEELFPGLLNATSAREETVERAVFVFDKYFAALRDANKTAWDLGDRGYICTNTAVEAHIRLIKDLLSHIDSNTKFTVTGKRPKAISEKLNDLQRPIIDFVRNKRPAALKNKFETGYGHKARTDYKDKLKKIVGGLH